MKRYLLFAFFATVLYDSHSQAGSPNLTGVSIANDGTLIIHPDGSSPGGTIMSAQAMVTAGALGRGVTVAGGNGRGKGLNQLNGPYSICVDNARNMYIADDFNNRIMKFPLDGDSTTNGIIVGGTGVAGIEPAMLNNPCGIARDKEGSVYTGGNGKVVKFPPGSISGTISVVAADGSAMGHTDLEKVLCAVDLHIDTAGYLYVLDQCNARVVRFPHGSVAGTRGEIIAGGNGIGDADNQLYTPTNFFFDSKGYIYISDSKRVMRFPMIGERNTHGAVVLSGEDQIDHGGSIFVDSFGYIYLSDSWGDRVWKFPPYCDTTTPGVIVAGGHGKGSAADQLDHPCGIYVDGNGDIYIPDVSNSRVQKWCQNQGSNQNRLHVTLKGGRYILTSHGIAGKDYIIYNTRAEKVAQHLIVSDSQKLKPNKLASGEYMLQIKGDAGSNIRFMVRP